MTGEQGRSVGAYRAIQAVHLLFFLGGASVVVAGSFRFARTAAALRARGHAIDGDVLRGPFIGISAGLLAAILGACVFLLLRKGGRWACWFSVVVWSALWFPLVVNVSSMVPVFSAPILVTLLCIGGSVFGTAAYFLLDPARPRPAGVKRDSPQT